MNCVRVFFNSFAKNLKYKSPACFEKYLEPVAFFFKRTKVKVFYTATDMAGIYDPPKHLKGMKVLDRNAFQKTIIVLSLTVPQQLVNDALTTAKNYLLKMRALKNVLEKSGNEEQILIDPKKANSWNDFDENTKEKLKCLGITESNFCKQTVDIKYENWGQNELIKAILPENETPLTSYTTVGHIIHLNIKDHLLDYKNVIGEILLDKVPIAKTVVYKKHFIDNVYRNFEMEVICGEPNFVVSVKANNCQFELDFSKVYWNPRLNTEHQRIINILDRNDVLFDVFAGVGPFSIPAAKKNCLVFANDLNPESFKWLNHSITLNKRAKGYITTYNKDGKDFILEDVKYQFLNILQDNLFCGNIHIVMNLPAMAPTFLKYFKAFINKSDLIKVDVEKLKKCLPIMHCYFFIHDDNCGKTVFERASEMSLDNVEHTLHFVRAVSGSCSMFRMDFTVPYEYLVADNTVEEGDEPLPKRICIK